MLAASVATVLAEEKGKLNVNLEPFRPLLGKTWKGDLKESGSDVVKTDISRWERALNGEAVRTVHSVTMASMAARRSSSGMPPRKN